MTQKVLFNQPDLGKELHGVHMKDLELFDRLKVVCTDVQNTIFDFVYPDIKYACVYFEFPWYFAEPQTHMYPRPLQFMIYQALFDVNIVSTLFSLLKKIDWDECFQVPDDKSPCYLLKAPYETSIMKYQNPERRKEYVATGPNPDKDPYNHSKYLHLTHWFKLKYEKYRVSMNYDAQGNGGFQNEPTNITRFYRKKWWDDENTNYTRLADYINSYLKQFDTWYNNSAHNNKNKTKTKWFSLIMKVYSILQYVDKMHCEDSTSDVDDFDEEEDGDY